MTQIELHKAKYRGHEHKSEVLAQKQERYDDLMGILNESIRKERAERNRQTQLKTDARLSGDPKAGGDAAPGTEKGKGGGKGGGKGKKGDGKGKAQDSNGEKGKEGGKKGKRSESKGKGKGKEGKSSGWAHKGDGAEDPLKRPDGKRFCVFYQVGQCKRGDECQYAHDYCTTAEQKKAAQSIRDSITAWKAKNAAAPATAQEGGEPKKLSRSARRRSASRKKAQNGE